MPFPCNLLLGASIIPLIKSSGVECTLLATGDNLPNLGVYLKVSNNMNISTRCDHKQQDGMMGFTAVKSRLKLSSNVWHLLSVLQYHKHLCRALQEKKRTLFTSWETQALVSFSLEIELWHKPPTTAISVLKFCSCWSFWGEKQMIMHSESDERNGRFLNASGLLYCNPIIVITT